MRLANPGRLVTIRQRHCAIAAVVADRNDVLDRRPPQHECWDRARQQPHQNSEFEDDTVPQMKRFARPRGAYRYETCPGERNKNRYEDDRVRPVGVVGWMESRCWVGGSGHPFVMEAERDGEGDYGREVDDENGDA